MIEDVYVKRLGRWFGWAAVAALVAGCGEPGSSAAADAGGGGPPPSPVEVVQARADTVVDAIFSTGQIEAVQSIELRPEVEGRIVEIFASEGTEVGRGTPLFKVDDAELTAEVARLTAERDLAAQALARTQDLLSRAASSEADLEQAEANFRSSRARLDLAEVRLARTLVRAPFSGVVGERLVSIGDYVTTSTRLTTLQSVDPQRAAFQVPERHSGQLADGQRVRFRVAALPDTEFVGTVDFVDPVVRLPGRTITVKASVPNPERLLRPGMFIEAELAAEVRPDATLIPEDAVLPLEGADYVWVVEGETAVRREVQLGVRLPGWVEVLSGVQAGETVVVGGGERLFEGAPVVPTAVERQPPS